MYNEQRNIYNLQTNIDDSMMKNINTEFKAYLLGLIASTGSISSEEITICLDEKHWELLTKIRNIISPNLNLTKLQNMISLKISSQITYDVIKHLKIVDCKKYNISLPDIDDNLKWTFIRGYFDGYGCIFVCNNNDNIKCNIKSNSNLILEQIKEFIKFPCCLYQNKIELYGLNVLDFLGKIYMGSSIHMKKNMNNL